MSDSDTLLVCSYEDGPDEKRSRWLLALSRNGSEWRETHRLQIDRNGHNSCALSGSQVLIGNGMIRYPYMELFRV